MTNFGKQMYVSVFVKTVCFESLIWHDDCWVLTNTHEQTEIQRKTNKKNKQKKRQRKSEWMNTQNQTQQRTKTHKEVEIV